MPPSTVTFGIAELLEMVLENATPTDLLLWQRVNKTWQAVIQGSPRLQKKLFIGIRLCKDKDEQEWARWNPFTVLFFQYYPYRCEFMTKYAFDGKASYPTASWKQMSLTSPAITALRVVVRDTEWFVKYDHTIVCESGVTLGQLVKTQEEGNILRADSDKGEYLYLDLRARDQKDLPCSP